MKNVDLFLDDYSDGHDEHGPKNFTKTKTRKRKWREIEQLKEQRRLKRELEQYELAQYEQYSY